MSESKLASFFASLESNYPLRRNPDCKHALVPLPYPPNFVEIANMPSTTALAINVFLRTSHDVMPNYQLSHEEIDDVVAFIMSLKDKKMP
jgi:hypothetical protein